MQKHVGWLSIMGSFGLLPVAEAQTPSPSAVITKFDGTYAFVSGGKVNETYTTWDEHPGRCPDLAPSTALTIIKGQVRFDQQEGTVGPNGELSARLIPTPFGKGGGNVGIEMPHYGRIDENGTIRVRRSGNYCSYDLIWQKVQVQSPSFPIASAQFDGTYAFVSSTRVNQTYTNRVTGQTGECPERGAGTLIIFNGQVHLPNAVGTVGSDGKLAMLRIPPGLGKVSGTIEKDGTVTARRTGSDCSYDTIWRKESK